MNLDKVEKLAKTLGQVVASVAEMMVEGEDTTEEVADLKEQLEKWKSSQRYWEAKAERRQLEMDDLRDTIRSWLTDTHKG